MFTHLRIHMIIFLYNLNTNVLNSNRVKQPKYAEVQPNSDMKYVKIKSIWLKFLWHKEQIIFNCAATNCSAKFHSLFVDSRIIRSREIYFIHEVILAVNSQRD
jgi:hypothetical protein